MNAFNDYIKPTMVLVVICAVVTGALALTEQQTTPIIDENNRIIAEAARQEVLPEAEGFTKYEGELPEGVVEMYTANNGVGSVVSSTATGYGGAVNVMTGISADGTVVMVKVLNHTETQGIGTNVINDEYLSQFTGKNAAAFGIELQTEAGDSVPVDAVAGATKTSIAIANNLKIAFEGYKVMEGGN